MKLSRFDPPAFASDFSSDQQRDGWSKEVSGYFDHGVNFNSSFLNVSSQFYHPAKTDTDEPQEEAVIDWPAFPKLVKDAFPDDRKRGWVTAEVGPDARAKFQDEYLEWHVVRNAANKITRVSFTCETTQYFDFLARTDKAKLLSIYKDLVDPAHQEEVQIDQLVLGAKYQPKNRWNTSDGAVHLIQPNNNLYAEVLIAAQACILRKRPDGTSITDSAELIDCAGYGEGGRASDPKIGAIVNDKAREGYSITLRNPVALYITHWSSQGWKKPNGSPVGDYWTLVRGKLAPGPNKPAMGLHLVYEVPENEGFVVGDIKIGGDTIEFGGQIAENINVGLFAVLCRKGQSHNPAFQCGMADDEVPLAGANLSLKRRASDR